MKILILVSCMLLAIAIVVAPTQKVEAVLDCDWDGSGYCCGGERPCSAINGWGIKMCRGPVVGDPSECPY